MRWVPAKFLFLFLFFGNFSSTFAQNFEARDRDEIRSKAIGLVKDFEQLLNVLATKGTTASDVQDIVNQATNEEGRMFYDAKVNVEDDLYSLKADSLSPKDVNIQKYLNDWDLFYTKSYDEAVSFSDLRLSEIQTKEYSYLKVYFQVQYKSKHKDFDQLYPIRKRIASIRFEKQGENWVAWINSLGFFSGKRPNGQAYTQESFEEDFKPFVKEKKARLVSSQNQPDSTLTATQIELQRKTDSLYAEAVKAQIQRSEEQIRKDQAYAKAILRGDSLMGAKQFPLALEAYTEARASKPLEIYPRTKINELTKLLASGSSDPKDLFDKQLQEGDRRYKNRDYEGARQSYTMALKIVPDHQAVKDKLVQSEKVIRNKSEIRSRYMAGNFKLALKDYNRIISEEKNNPDYYFERGRCYQTMGDSKKAMADFNKSLELDNNFQDALVSRAQLFVKSGDLVKAISDFTTLINIDPVNGDYRLRRGLLLSQVNDFDAAIRDFNEALKINGKDVQAFCGRSEAFRRKGQLDQSLLDAEEAIKLAPGFSSGQFQKGLAQLDRGEDEAAGIAILKSIRMGLNPEQEKYLEIRFQEYLKKADGLEAEKKYEESIPFLKKALLVRPKSHEGFFRLANEYQRLSRWQDALKNLDQAIFLRDDFVPAYLAKARLFLHLKEYKNVLEPGYRVRKLDRKNLDACVLLGETYMGMAQYDSAMTWFGKALELKPNSGFALLKRGKCHFIMENYRRSLMDFEDAIKEDKKNAEAYFYKGKINKALKQFDKAIDDFNEALDLGYSKYECATEIGIAHADMGHHSKAIKFFTNAIKEEPNRGQAYAMRGLSYLAEEDFKNAMADLDESIKIDTALGLAAYRIELGFLKLRFEDYKAAEIQFNKALDFDPYSARGNYGLAATLFQLGKTDLSLRAFEQAFIPRKLDYDKIKKDPWMKDINKNKDFKRLVKAYFK